MGKKKFKGPPGQQKKEPSGGDGQEKPSTSQQPASSTQDTQLEKAIKELSVEQQSGSSQPSSRRKGQGRGRPDEQGSQQSPGPVQSSRHGTPEKSGFSQGRSIQEPRSQQTLSQSGPSGISHSPTPQMNMPRGGYQQPPQAQFSSRGPQQQPIWAQGQALPPPQAQFSSRGPQQQPTWSQGPPPQAQFSSRGPQQQPTWSQGPPPQAQFSSRGPQQQPTWAQGPQAQFSSRGPQQQPTWPQTPSPVFQQPQGQQQFSPRHPQQQPFAPRGHQQQSHQEQQRQQQISQTEKQTFSERTVKESSPKEPMESVKSDESKLAAQQKRRRGKQQAQKGEQMEHPTVTPTKESPREQKSEQKPQPTKMAAGEDTKKIEVKARKETSPTDFIVPLRKKLNLGGTRGRAIMIETNHLALSFKKLNPAIHYDVAIEPDKPKKLMRSVMEQFRLNNYRNRFPAFDGIKNLYSSSPLPFGDEISGEVTVSEDERDRQYKVKVKFANQVDLNCLVQYFESAARGNTHMVTPQEAIQCIDIVLRNAPSLHCIPVGRSFFVKPDRRQMIDLGEGMEMYHGFYQSAVLGWKPYLNVDVSHKAFPKELPVLDLIMELADRYYKLQDPLTRENFEVVDKFLRTLKVQYMIPNQPNTKRVMRVNQLDKPANQYRFKNENNLEMTVSEYFEKIKGVRLKYPHLPCLWVGSRQREPRIQLPMEFCILADGQVTNRPMTANQTSAMIRSAATSTDVRKNKIMTSIRQANYGQDPCAQEFGISVNQDFTKVKARVLPPPAIKYFDREVPVSRGCWRADKFCKPGSLDTWSIVCLNERTRPQELDDFATMMMQQGRPLGMSISKPLIVPIRLMRGKEKQIIEQEFQKLKSSRLILVVIPDIKDIYNYVKQAAELRVGVITQCVKSKNLYRPKPSTVGNILLKVNAKLNGLNHVLASTPACFRVPCMVMGADVTHPSPESRGSVPSVAAVTASHDRNAFKYNITCRLQKSTQEIITDLAEIVREHLTYFQQQNNLKPERIIFFRDGVSEGQFEIVVNSEVQAVRRACQMIDPSGAYRPKLTFLVVQKRHHTRFFPTNTRDSEDRNNNVPAGTVVDTEITHPTALDFYLVSHASIQGVARPTKYRKLWDENDMQEDELEELTYHLCHMFARCTRSVSYPAPTYYAHLAAARAKVYCERQNINMNNLEREQQSLLNIKPEVVKGTPMYFV